jgi:hypothetical protein
MALKWFMTLLLIGFVAGCGGGGNGSPAVTVAPTVISPTVISTSPVDNAVTVPTNRKLTATFSQAMSSATLVDPATTFTLHDVTAASGVVGVVTYDATNHIATFKPTANLTTSSLYTATITTGAKDSAGNALASNKIWSFTTGTSIDTTAPTVTSTIPVDAASGVAVNSNIYANFSESMDSTTITATNFTVTKSGVPVSGAVTYTGATATFKPAANLTASTTYTATITTGVTDLAANSLASNKTWSFTTGTASTTSPLPVDLGTAANYAILAKTGVSTTGTTAVVGNVAVSPAARGYLTGWSQTYDVTDTYATSTYVASPGKLYAADLVGGTTSVDLTTAVGNMETAYTAAAGMAPAGGALAGGVPGAACPNAGGFGGVTFHAGVYTCAVNVGIASNMVLSGSATDVWVFQITGNLTQASATQVQLTGGALAKNVFWQVAGSVDIGTTALMQGVILGKTLINLQTGATENGRLLSQTAVTLQANHVTQP